MFIEGSFLVGLYFFLGYLIIYNLEYRSQLEISSFEIVVVFMGWRDKNCDLEIVEEEEFIKY